MSLTAAALKIMADKGLTEADIAEVADALKRKPTQVTEPRTRTPPPEPTNRRKGSSWRARVYGQLIERDGPMCAECGCAERTIWRKAGLWNNDDWGLTEDGRAVALLSGVNPSSNLEVDHVLPLRDGGTNCLTNLWLLCVSCHKDKTAAEHSDRLRRMFAEGRK